MPTHDEDPRFVREFLKLSPAQQVRFLRAVAELVADLRTGSPRPGLRVRVLGGHPGVFELTWASDGRATFRYGPEAKAGHSHIIWQRIGTHDIFRDP